MAKGFSALRESGEPGGGGWWGEASLAPPRAQVRGWGPEGIVRSHSAREVLGALAVGLRLLGVPGLVPQAGLLAGVDEGCAVPCPAQVWSPGAEFGNSAA